MRVDRRLTLVAFLAVAPWVSAQSLPSSAATTGPGLAVLRGRCVEAGTNEPLAGARVSFGGWTGNDQEMARHGNPEAPKLEPVLTGADGRFELRFVPPPPLQWSLDITLDGHAPRTGRWHRFEPGQVEDLGTIEMQKGHRVRGKVVDELGAPVARCHVSIHRMPLPIRGDMAANDTRSGTSDEHGEFEVRCLVPPGTYPIEAQGRGFAHAGPPTVRVSEARGAEPLTVTVKRMRSLSGVVVDEAGKPVRGVDLASDESSSGRTTSTWTRDDGTFVLWAQPSSPASFGLYTSDPADCARWKSGERYEWGRSDVRIVLQRLPTLELTVVEKDTKKPVEAFAVGCNSPDLVNSGLRLGGAHPDGKVVVDKVARGKNVLVVVPNEPGLAHSGKIEFTVADSGPVSPLRVELARKREIAFTVRLASGAAMAGTRVELCVPHGGLPVTLGPLGIDYELGDVDGMLGGDPSHLANPELLGAATSDPAGVARVFVSRASDAAIVRVLGPGHAPVLVPLAGLAKRDGSYEIQVTPSATIEGRVSPKECLTLGLTIGLEPKGPRHDGPFVPPVRVAGDGTFQIRDVGEGEWLLVPQVTIMVGDEHGAGGGPRKLPGAGIEIKSVAGETQRVELRLDAWVPGTLEGIVTVDDKPPENGRLYLKHPTRGSRAYGVFVPEATGRFRAPGLLPGRYVLEVVLGSGRDATSLVSDDEIEIGPGATVKREFRLRR